MKIDVKTIILNGILAWLCYSNCSTNDCIQIAQQMDLYPVNGIWMTETQHSHVTNNNNNLYRTRRSINDFILSISPRHYINHGSIEKIDHPCTQE